MVNICLETNITVVSGIYWEKATFLSLKLINDYFIYS